MKQQAIIDSPIAGMHPVIKGAAYGLRALYRILTVLRNGKAAEVKTMAKEVTRQDFKQTKLEVGDAIFCKASEAEHTPASRIVVIPLTAAKGLEIGRIWLYLYQNSGKIRRVFKVDDEQVRSILGCKRAYYMTDLQWDPHGGEKEIDRIRQQAAADVERLVVTSYDIRVNRGKKANCEYKGTVKIAEPAVAVTATAKPAEPQAHAVQSAQGIMKPAPSGSVVRPVAGNVYEGVISEMGHTTRQGSNGPYKAFCVKVEKAGVHSPLYGVELEREIIERRAAPGDTVRITFMKRAPIEGESHGMWKNLYKVEVLQKAAK